MKSKIIIPFFLGLILTTFSFGETVTMHNPTDQPYMEVPVIVDLPENFQADPGSDYLLMGNEIIPAQLDDLDLDGKKDALVTVCSLGSGETVEYTLQKNSFNIVWPDRAHAGMYLKGIEGPGWESDRLAFRLYWDQRNATDIFGKKKPALGLQQYARPDVNYHYETPWGMDILKVGSALGAGGFGIWLDGKVQKVTETERDYKVIADGPVRSIIDLYYKNWVAGSRKFDLLARISMIAGQKYCTIELWLAPLDGKPLPEFVTGVVKHEETVLVSDRNAGYLGRWGLQALDPGEKPRGSHLGLGVVVDPENIVEFGEDAVNSYVRLRGENKAHPLKKDSVPAGYIRYHAHASWINEPGGADSTETYKNMLENMTKINVITSIRE